MAPKKTDLCFPLMQATDELQRRIDSLPMTLDSRLEPIEVN